MASLPFPTLLRWKHIPGRINYIYCRISLRSSSLLLCSSYRRSLQLSKETIQHFKTWTFTNFFLLLQVIFALLDPDSGSGSTGPIESGSNPDPKPCLLVHSSSSNLFINVAIRLLQGPWRKSTICLRPSNMFCLFIETYWSNTDSWGL